MASVFISYSRKDRELAATLATVLESAGFIIWWDHELVTGEAFRSEIKRKLSSSDAVVVIWTEHSIESEWVLDEAEEAKAAGKLYPVRLPSLDYRAIPLGFRSLQTDMLDQPDRLLNSLGQKRSDLAAAAPQEAIERLLDAVRRRSNPGASRRRVLLAGAGGIAAGAALVRGYDVLTAKSRLVRSVKLHEGPLKLLAVTEDDQSLVSVGEDGRVAFLDRTRFERTAEARLPLDKVASAVLVSRPQQEILVTDGARIGIWTRQAGWSQLAEQAPEHLIRSLRNFGSHPSERRLFALTQKGAISEWRFVSGALAQVYVYELGASNFIPVSARRIVGTIPLFLYSAGSEIRVGQANGKPREEDSFTGKWVMDGHSGAIRQLEALPLAPAPNLFVFSASDDATVRMWDVYSLRALHAFSGHEGGVTAVAVQSKETSTALLSGGADGTVRAWSAQRRAPIEVIGRHRAPVDAIVLSRDGTQAISSSVEGEVRVWSLSGLTFELLTPPSRT